jgi:hypothetical protein
MSCLTTILKYKKTRKHILNKMVKFVSNPETYKYYYKQLLSLYKMNKSEKYDQDTIKKLMEEYLLSRGFKILDSPEERQQNEEIDFLKEHARGLEVYSSELNEKLNLLKILFEDTQESNERLNRKMESRINYLEEFVSKPKKTRSRVNVTKKKKVEEKQDKN